MSSYFVILSYRNGNFVNSLPTSFKSLNKKSLPVHATLGFRLIYSKVFNNSSILDVNYPVTLLGCKSIIKSISVFVSGPDQLDATEPNDIILILELSTLKDKNLKNIFQEARNRFAITEQDIAEMLRRKLRSIEGGILASITYKGRLGYSLFTPTEDGVNLKDISAYCAFYYYGWLIFQRLEREQATIALSINNKKASEQLERIPKMRIKILNLSRYFLTMNRSTNEKIQHECNKMLKHYRLEERYNRHLSLHNSFEKHLGNIVSIAESERYTISKKMYRIIAFFGVPLGAFSALLAIQLGSDIFVEPFDIVQNKKVWMLFLGSLFIPVFFVIISLIIDKMRHVFSK